MASTTETIHYPSSDGKPLAENTKQYRWITTIQSNIEKMVAGREIFVGADNLIYPVEGKPKINVAPDVYVVFGRPQKDIESYKIWEEGGIFPQVIFEVWSHTNKPKDMVEKRKFYERYGCLEYIEINPKGETLAVWARNPTTDRLESVTIEEEWTSPLLGIRFVAEWEELRVYYPNGERFLTMMERCQLLDELSEEVHLASRRDEYQRQQLELERQRAEAERQRAEAERQRAEAERQRAQQREAIILAKLREQGIDPDSLQLP